MPLALEPLLTMHADLDEPQVIGPGPWGTRQVFVIRGGWFRGDRLEGEMLPGGGDWAVVGADGVARLDVRLTLKTADGALVYVVYTGVLPMTDAVFGALTGSVAPTEFGELDYLISARLETGDSRYGWLNSAVTVGRGRVLAGAVEYELYEVAAR